MFDQYLYEYLYSFFSNLYFVSADKGTHFPFYIMMKLDDPERPETLCDNQGETGQAVYVFRAFIQQGNTATAIVYLDALKQLVSSVRGIFGTAPNQYRIWYNETRGIVPVDSGDNTLQIYGAEFNTVLFWEKI